MAAEGLRLVGNDEGARTGRLQLNEGRDERVGGADDSGVLHVRRQPQGKRNVIAAGADQIKPVRVGDAVIGGEIVADLRHGGHRAQERIGLRVGIYLGIAGVAGGVIGAARRVRRIGGEAEKAGEQLRVDRPGIRRGRAAALRYRDGEVGIVSRIGRIRRGIAIPAAVDRAVTEDDDLADGLAPGAGRAADQRQRGANAATFYVGQIHRAAVPTGDDGNYGLESAVATCVLLTSYFAAALGAVAASAW